jgi:hypothetical protein
MAGITLAIAQENLTAWLAASTAVAKSQSYRISVNGSERQLARADAAEIREQIKFWDAQVKALDPSCGRTRSRRIVFG